MIVKLSYIFIFCYINHSTDTSGAGIINSCITYSFQSQSLGFFKSHIISEIFFNKRLNKSTSRSSRCPFCRKNWASWLNLINLRTMIWVPSGNNHSGLQKISVLIDEWLQNSSGSFDIWKLFGLKSLLFDIILDLTSEKLSIGGTSGSLDKDFFGNVIEFIGCSIRNVWPRTCSWVGCE